MPRIKNHITGIKRMSKEYLDTDDLVDYSFPDVT